MAGIWDLGQAAESWAKGNLTATKPQFEDLPDGWETMILSGFAEGRGPVEVWLSIPMQNGKRRLTRAFWNKFIKENEYFAAVVDFGLEIYEAWWVARGREKLEERDFNHVLYYMNMKNRHGWRDKIEHEHKKEIRRKFAKKPDDTEWLQTHKPKTNGSGRHKQARKPH